MSKAILSGSMYIPVDLVDGEALNRVLTVSYTPMGEDPVEIALAEECDGYFRVPRQYGLNLCNRLQIPYIDQTTQGRAVKFPKVPAPRDYQVEPLERVLEACHDYYDFIFRARTGWGKTIGSLILAARLGRSTLILVDQNNLKDQWHRDLVKHFGFKPEAVGEIQGKVCRYEGCAVTIAMVHTLRGYPPDHPVFDAFGLVLIDETHVIAAPTFSLVLPLLSAAYRVGVSATPKRKDGLQKVLTYHLGRVRVYVDDEHDESSVYVLTHPTVYSWYANSAPKIGRFLTEVSEDCSRNLLVAEAACYLYDTGRDVLVLSDRIEHLRGLLDLCYYLGVPIEDMGLYTGYNPVYAYAKNATPQRLPSGYVRGSEFTPVKLQLISKRLSKAQLEKVKGSARIIFATYGMFAKGVDVPRLNGGVDATPRSESEQVHGRILRKVPGKQRSIWITVADSNSYRSMYSLASRLKGYEKNNAVLFEGNLDEGWTECPATKMRAESLARVKVLKSTRIGTNSAGLNTLLTKQDEMRLLRQRATATTKTRADRPRS